MIYLIHRRPKVLLWAAPILCAVLGWFPGWHQQLAYDRGAIASGEFWRMWSGHYQHFGSGHLLPNLLAAVVMIGLLDNVRMWQMVNFLLIAPFAISAILFQFCPQLELYAGFSGLAVGLSIWVVAQRVSMDKWDRPGWILLTMILSKILWEMKAGSTLFATYHSDAFKTETTAHLAGALVVLFYCWWPGGRLEKGKESKAPVPFPAP